IETRWHSPPINSGSVVRSITSTLPCAGERMRLEPGGTLASGSRKKYKVKRENKAQSASTKGVTAKAPTPNTAISTVPKAISAQKTITAIRVITMILKAGLRALPECFMPGKGTVWPAMVKGKVPGAEIGPLKRSDSKTYILKASVAVGHPNVLPFQPQ